jgi:hypothetical protein
MAHKHLSYSVDSPPIITFESPEYHAVACHKRRQEESETKAETEIEASFAEGKKEDRAGESEAKPSEISVKRQTTFDFVLNLTTAT